MSDKPKTAWPPQTNQWIATEIADGTFEGIEQRWCAELPGPETRDDRGGVALDLGAGIGLVTRVLREKYARVVAVEGNVTLAPFWAKNNEGAAFGRCELRNAIVGGGDLRVSDEEWWKSTTSAAPITGATKTRPVVAPRVAFVDLLSELQPNVVVMDIEGAEQFELLDAITSIEHAHLCLDDLIIELHPGLWPEYVAGDTKLRDGFVRSLVEAGYKMIRNDVAPGWPPGTPHPLAIEHVWMTRRAL